MRAFYRAARLGAAAGVVWFSCAVGFVCQRAAGASPEPIVDSIRAERLMRHVEYLAGDALEGRLAGSRGGRLAGDYLRSEIRRLGLRAVGTDGYAQPFGPGYRNLLGLLPGSDRTAGMVMVCAHYDHVGLGTKQNSRGPIGQIHHGADDNASGTAAVIELAQAFERLPRPRCSILFAFWDAEEEGMLGSRYWLDHPTLPLDRLAAAVNLDMVGRLRDNRLTVYGTRTGCGLRRLVSLDNAERMLIDFSWELEDDADHYPIFRHGIPVLFLFTGEHPDYHSPRDVAERLNPEGLCRVTRLAFQIVTDLVDRADRPVYRAVASGETEALRRQVEGTGTTLAPNEEVKGGVILTAHQSPSPPTPLPQAGEGSYRALTQAGERSLDAASSRLRLGVTFHADDAEPGAAVVSGVVPGSPAAMAGLRAGDRIYDVGGKQIESEAAFQRLVAGSGPVLELTIERDGQVRPARAVVSGQWAVAGGQ